MRKYAVVAVLVTAFLLLFAAPVIAQPRGQAMLSPSQAAWLKAESRRIEDQFVSDIAQIAATDQQRVRRAMPDERRITEAAPRVIAALEMDLGRPLSDGQRAAIFAADQARHAALARAREEAARR